MKTKLETEFSRLHLLGRFRPGNLLRFFTKIIKNSILYGLAILCGAYEVVWLYLKQQIRRCKVPNYRNVDHALHRGGQPSAKALKKLAKQGIKTIINLRVGNFNPKVVEEYSSNSIRMVHLPFAPYDPQDQVMIDFLKILINPKQTPAFVHCFHGVDRTGTVCAMYRIIVQNWNKEKAIAEMKKNGLHWWHRNLVDYISNVDIEHIRKEIGLQELFSS